MVEHTESDGVGGVAILSDMGSDGMLGLRAVKEKVGMGPVKKGRRTKTGLDEGVGRFESTEPGNRVSF